MLKLEFKHNSFIYTPQEEVNYNSVNGQIVTVYTLENNSKVYYSTCFIKSPVTRKKVIDHNENLNDSLIV